MSQSQAHRLFTIGAYPLRYLVIPKCACTYIKNLLWYLENRQLHPNQRRVHENDSKFLRADQIGLSDDQLASESFAFTVLRNPVDRFFSLYTDKVVGPGHNNYVPLRRVLHERHGLNLEASSALEHSRNCGILIEWLGENLKSEVDLPKDAHWTPQSYREGLIRRFDLRLLLVNDLRRQLGVFLRPMVSDIDDVLELLEKNKSEKQFPLSQILSPQLRNEINSVYKRDRELFNLTNAAWEIQTHDSAVVVPPRYSSVVGG